MNVTSTSTFNSAAMVAYSAEAKAKASANDTGQATKNAKTGDAVSLSKNPPTTAVRLPTTRHFFRCAKA
ncbi:hypothetical protein [Pseudomonas sp. TH31]|uniref:hypothetical protein n=1 Tax=Pseudomonas sp. TH31 TaxID=2796396 RepID=UPI001F5B6FA8|nr:hypothetical protein [Pseudomonas sp. TH31]